MLTGLVQVQLQTEHCNDTRLAAKRVRTRSHTHLPSPLAAIRDDLRPASQVGEASAELFLGLFVGECGPVVQPATVIQVHLH